MPQITSLGVGGAVAANGKLIESDFQFAGGSSVLFDTVYVTISDEGAKTLRKEAAVVAWVQDAFVHCKVIGAPRLQKPFSMRLELFLTEAY